MKLIKIRAWEELINRGGPVGAEWETGDMGKGGKGAIKG